MSCIRYINYDKKHITSVPKVRIERLNGFNILSLRYNSLMAGWFDVRRVDLALILRQKKMSSELTSF